MKCLGKGVDTLVINYFGKLKDGILGQLEEKKDAAKKDGGASYIIDSANKYDGVGVPENASKMDEFDKARASFDSIDVLHEPSMPKASDVARYAKECGLPENAPWLLKVNRYQFSVAPHSGGTMFRYLLKNSCFDLRISAGESEKSVAIQAYIHATYLWSEGWERAWLGVRSVCQELLVQIITEQISRVDICADFDMENPFKIGDVDRFCTRSQKKSWHWKPKKVDDLAAFKTGDSFTGASFGAGKAIRARLYDKSRELKGSDKERLMTDVWGGWTDSAWRVEYQLRREALKTFKIESVHDLRAVLVGIWRYLTDWLSLKIEGAGKQKTRWRVDDRWLVVQAVEWIGSMVRRYRQYDKTVGRLVDMVAGCVTSIMAITGGTLESVLERICRRVFYDPSLDRKVEQKRSRYA